MTDTTTDQPDIARTKLLHALADWLADHPTVDPHSIDVETNSLTAHVYSLDTRTELLAAARTIGGHWTKKAGGVNGELFTLTRKVLPCITVELTAWRNQVCERVVTGTETVEVNAPDPEAVAALPKVKRTETREIVEWRCEPLHAADPLVPAEAA